MQQVMKQTMSKGSEMETARQIWDLLSDVYEQSPWTLEQIESDLAQESTHYFYLFNQQEMVGFLAIQDLAGELEITNIAVKKDFQGQGVASRLLENLQHRQEPIFLEVRDSNLAARALYQKNGFHEIGRRKHYYHNPIEDAVLMMRVGLEDKE